MAFEEFNSFELAKQSQQFRLAERETFAVKETWAAFNGLDLLKLLAGLLVGMLTTVEHLVLKHNEALLFGVCPDVQNMMARHLQVHTWANSGATFCRTPVTV